MGRQNIQELWLKGKALLDSGVGEWGLIVLISLAIMASFGLGRLSALVEAKPLINVHTASAAAGAALGTPMAPGGQFVASRTGAVYYYPWCSGALQIKPENERWFVLEKDAQAAGYRAAKNCKGLE